MADVFHRFSGEGKYRRTHAAAAAIAVLEIGDSILFSGTGVARKTATSTGTFAGFAHTKGAVAAAGDVVVEMADRVFVLGAAAAAGHLGDYLEAGAGAQTLAVTNATATDPTPDVPANSSRIGQVISVEAGVGWLVDTRKR